MNGSGRMVREYLYGCLHLTAQWLRFARYRRPDWQSLRAAGYRRTSDTLVVLGAGPSAKDAIQHIPQGSDVLALSYAALLPVRVSVAFFEFAPPIQAGNQARLFELLRDKESRQGSDGRECLYLYKSHLRSNTISALGSVAIVPALIIPALSRPVVAQLYKLIVKMGVHGRYIVQLDGLGSLSSVISFARWFGYKRIMLGGIDIATRKYFFDAEEFRHFGLANPFALEGHEDLDIPHPTSPGTLQIFAERLTALSGNIRLECLLPDTPLASALEQQRAGSETR